MKKVERKAGDVRAEIVQQAKVIAYDRTAQLGSPVLSSYLDYMRRLLKELAACREE